MLDIKNRKAFAVKREEKLINRIRKVWKEATKSKKIWNEIQKGRQWIKKFQSKIGFDLFPVVGKAIFICLQKLLIRYANYPSLHSLYSQFFLFFFLVFIWSILKFNCFLHFIYAVISFVIRFYVRFFPFFFFFFVFGLQHWFLASLISYLLCHQTAT